jgi:hypothetical protein
LGDLITTVINLSLGVELACVAADVQNVVQHNGYSPRPAIPKYVQGQK